MGGPRWETERRNNPEPTALGLHWRAFLPPSPGAPNCPALEPFPEVARGFFWRLGGRFF
jgi:hypothetical protein